MNRALMLRFAACGVMGLGAALLVAALLLSTYTTSRITKVPLDIDATLISDGKAAKALDAASLNGNLVISEGAAVRLQQQISVESPANADVVTLQVGSTVRRTDKQTDSGLLLAIVDTVTLNRKTAMAVHDDSHPGGSIQRPRGFGDENPPTTSPLPHEGLSYRFPFHTEKKTYQYFDPIAQKAYPASFEAEEDVNGLTTYRFIQTVGYTADGKLDNPVPYPSLYTDRADSKVTMSAAKWGLPGDPEEQVTLNRFYAAQRTFWVDPISGTIVKEKEHANHYFAHDREPAKADVTLIDYQVASTDDTVQAQVNAARDERDRLALWSRVLPITFLAVGLIALIGGGVLAAYSLRTESALTDPSLDRDGDLYGHGVGEQRVPGAEAETEKLPAQRADLSEDPSPAGSDPPEPTPPESGPPDS